MSIVKIFVCMILVFLRISNYGVKGVGRLSTSYEQMGEDLELERQLTILNKPPIKTIQTIEGQIFDCIDIYKQPAFENQLLKSHKIQMGPSSSSPTNLRNENKIKSDRPLLDVLKRLSCPQGTVPIRRTTKEDLRRFTAFSKSIHSNNIIHPSNTNTPGVQLAYWRTKDGATNILHGAKAEINIANPLVANDQYSGSQIWIEAGHFEDANTIQAGWAVAPSIYGDNQTHVTTYWKGQGKNGCYNLLCPGFIQVDKDYALGDVLSSISKYDTREQYSINICIKQDNDTGNWWLQGGGQEIANIGYWPKQLFSHLVNGATRVAWGGIVKGVLNGSSPQMGNGYFPDHSYYKAASLTNLQILTELEYSEGDFEGFVDKPECYNLEYDGNVGKQQGVSLLFGGPGGNKCGN